MSKLIYAAIASLDGYVADKDGRFDWSAPDAEVHAFVNDLERPIGTYLYGRRMYDVMVVWENAHAVPDQTPETEDYASIWKSADKIVYSTTLREVNTARTRVESEFDPEAIRTLKSESEADISIGGPHLAASALRAGLVDECHLFVSPAIVGGGNAWLPDDLRVDLKLIDQRRFGNGVVYLRYAVSP